MLTTEEKLELEELKKNLRKARYEINESSCRSRKEKAVPVPMA